MDRLVYSPSIKAWVKTDTGIVDLSPYIVSCTVNRNVDDLSHAELEFRNPKVLVDGKPRFIFTENHVNGQVLPVFHPMDPITIVLQRLADRPIQVFTGYCDTVPDVQLFPGTAKITASCTLKRLLYTYWDPALEFVSDFMSEYGWNLNRATGQVGTTSKDLEKISKVNNLNDSSIASLLYVVLNEVGGWNDKNIYIQPLPKNVAPMVVNLFDQINKDNKQVNQEISDFIRTIIGSGSFGTSVAGGSTPDGAQPSSGGTGWVTVGATWYDDTGPGSTGKLGKVDGYNYAELGTATDPDKTGKRSVATGFGWIAKAMGLQGELPDLQKLEIRYKGKSIFAYKTDRGYGQGGDGYVSDSNYAIDLWKDAADAFGDEFKNAGRVDVQVRRVD